MNAKAAPKKRDRLYHQRSQQQKSGTAAERFVGSLVDDSNCWIARPQPEEDFGIDLELELEDPDVRGELLKVQIKSAVKAVYAKGQVRMSLSRKLLGKAEHLRLPIILVWVDMASKKAYYLWVQSYFLKHFKLGTRLLDLPANITVWVPVTATLPKGLLGELKDIAQWKTQDQLVLGLIATIRSAVHNNNAAAMDLLGQALAALDFKCDDRTIDQVVDSVIEYGLRIWGTDEGYKRAGFLYDVCRRMGGCFTRDQVERLVLREGRYSRTGMNALGILYDHHRVHISAMKLPQRFQALESLQLEYYCTLREKYPDRNLTSLIVSGELTACGVKSENDMLMDKWASRGDSAVLDYLVPVVPQPGAGTEQSAPTADD